MGHLLRKINGAVFFVDILGFGALTQNKIQLEDQDLDDWNIPPHLDKDNQSLAATILVEFRKILHKFDAKYKDVTVSQLSDCAFVWSENICDVIIVAHNIMWACLNAGILCRAGLSCGEIIETSENNELGRLIAGKAVSDAVKLESIAKGTRVMINTDVSVTLYNYNQKFHTKIYQLFQPVINPLDYATYDEFKWYYIPELNIDSPGLHEVDRDFILNATKCRLKLASSLRLHPRFGWNSKGKEGLAQLVPSVSFISANEQIIFKISHWFDWNNVCDKKSKKSLKNIENRIDSDFMFPKMKNGVITFRHPE